jgi:hypothetical protein
VRVPSTVPLLLSLVQKPVGAYINIICAFHDKILLPSLVISAKKKALSVLQSPHKISEAGLYACTSLSLR